MASHAVFYIDGSRSWQQCQRQRSSRCRSPMRHTDLCRVRRCGGRVMTLLPPGVKVRLALGYIDMRKGIDGLAMLVQRLLRDAPFSGPLFVCRGRPRRANSGHVSLDQLKVMSAIESCRTAAREADL